MKEEISHPGKIIEITPEYTSVSFTALSACSSCHAGGFCGVADSQEKIIQLPTKGDSWKVGQEVDVCLRRGMGFKAVFLAYALPLLLLIAVLLGLAALGVKEWIAGLAAVGATGIYYLVLRIFKDKLSDEYTFYIKEKE